MIIVNKAPLTMAMSATRPNSHARIATSLAAPSSNKGAEEAPVTFLVDP
jgi:hypothetical protein